MVAKIRREGKDVTVVSYGNAIHLALQAAEKLAAEGIDCEVIDLRSLRPWDKKTVFASVMKTNRCVVAHEHYKTGGFGGEIASAISEELFRYLDAPVARVASKDVPVGFSKILENAILLNVNDISEAVRKTVHF